MVEDELSNLSNSMELAINPDIHTSATTRREQSIELTSITTLDGKVISKNTQKHVTREQSANTYARGE